MFGLHCVYCSLRVEVQALGEKSFGSLSKLPFLGKCSGSASVVGGLRCRSWASSLWLARCLAPKVLEAAFAKSRDPVFDSGGFVSEGLFARGKKEDKLSNRECLAPVVLIVGVVEDLIPG